MTTQTEDAATGSAARDASRELDALIAAMMEPKPAPISARALRATYRNWVWYSDFWHNSPDGWWTAQIGTDHGLPEKDDDPVRWRPAREPSANIEEAWLVVEALRPRFWTKIAAGMRISDMTPLYECAMGEYATETTPSRQLAYERDVEIPFAICRAALLAVGAA